MPNPNYVSPRRLYLNADGKPVERDDPGRLELLVTEGGELPMEQAVALGLVEPEPEPAAEPAPAEAT
jgi:hypothetical protein